MTNSPEIYIELYYVGDLMKNDAIFNMKVFDTKNKEIAELFAFLSGKTIYRDGDKLYLMSIKDLEKEATELFKDGKYLEAEELIKTSGETINRKKYLDTLLSTTNSSYRFSLISYLKLINSAIKQKSNVSTILKKDIIEQVRGILKEQNIPIKEKNLILTTIENWEKQFKEKEWSTYSIFSETNFDSSTDIPKIGTYEYACEQKIKRIIEKELKKGTKDPLDVDIMLFFEDDIVSKEINTQCTIEAEKPELKISIDLRISIIADYGPTTEDKKFYFKSKYEEETGYIKYTPETEVPEPPFYELNWSSTKKIPLDKISSFEEENLKEKIKQILIPNKPNENKEEPKSFEELKKTISNRAENKIEEIIGDRIATKLSSQSNVVTLSAPKLIHIMYTLSKIKG